MFAKTSFWLLVNWAVCCGDDLPPRIPSIPAYPIPSDVSTTLDGVANQVDVLFLGEMPGSQEVPQIGVSLLPKLSKLGYHTLALELPSDQHSQLHDWATGKTDIIPEFFEKPNTGGRGNIQLLSLIRTAVSPPHQWNLICFDLSKPEWEVHLAEYRRIDAVNSKNASSPTNDLHPDEIKNWQTREKRMTSNLLEQQRLTKANSKILVICGGSHARLDDRKLTPPEDKSLWPTLAVCLRQDVPDWKVGSVNIVFHTGTIFGYGKINQLSGPVIEKMLISRCEAGDYPWELHLPVSTAGTFLSVPSGN